MDRRLLLATLVSILIFSIFNFAYVGYYIGNKVDYQQITTDLCDKSEGIQCPQSSFLIEDDVGLNQTYDLLNKRGEEERPKIDFEEKSVIFVYVNVLNSGWEFEILGITESEDAIQVHIFKQRLRQGEFQTVLEYYFLFEVPVIEKSLDMVITEQGIGISWLAIIFQFLTGFLIIIVIVQFLRETKTKMRNKTSTRSW